MGERVRAHAILRGRVQGVGFRFFAVDWAERLGVCGYARNLPDGALEVVAEGDPEAVRSFLEAMRRGPRAARVEDMQVRWEAPRGEHGFSIRY
ncbi:MAG: acylphosphatase [Armatimonadetes bacterium]|nr:acylphosphatase [Armatimonadota bacterium]MDW8153271.1 acylphosphatase [Armatimonadota bacterium]